MREVSDGDLELLFHVVVEGPLVIDLEIKDAMLVRGTEGGRKGGGVGGCEGGEEGETVEGGKHAEF